MSPPPPKEEVLERTKTVRKEKKIPPYRVLLMNDDYTPMEFVVEVLMDIFGKGEKREAPAHVWSKPVAGTLTPEDRRFIAAEALRWALTRALQLGGKSAARSGGPRAILAIDDLHAVDAPSRAAFADVIAEPPLGAILVLAAHVPGFDPGWRAGSERFLTGLPTSVAASLVKGTSPMRG